MRTHAATAVLLACCAGSALAATGLQQYNVNASLVTVGGLSSGGFAAVQMHFAFSSLFKGAAVFAGGPYMCAQGSVNTALTTCKYAMPEGPDVQSLAQQARQAAAAGKLDGIQNVTNARVYLYSGTADTVVYPAVMKSADAFYKLFIGAGGKLVTDFGFDSEHCIPTLSFGEPCTEKGSPYLGDCNYDGAGKALSVLYPGLAARGSAVSANVLSFDQTQYGASSGISMGDKGYVYVPTACAKGAACGLHVLLHGCQQTLADIGTDFVEHAGFNEWAESNNLIVLYPQVAKSPSGPQNPYGCWDWWGYTDGAYGTRSGAQNKVVRKMVAALMGA